MAEASRKRRGPLPVYVASAVGALLMLLLLVPSLDCYYIWRTGRLRRLLLTSRKARESEDVACELASLSVGREIELVQRAYGLPEYRWRRLGPADTAEMLEMGLFQSPPPGADLWLLDIGPSVTPFFLVVDGVVVDWYED